jgi:hypothetical protein
MAKRDDNYQIIYRGDTLTKYVPGGWVFFQRPKKNGGGYWLGRTIDGAFMFEFSEPVSLSQGLLYLQQLSSDVTENLPADDDFSLL